MSWAIVSDSSCDLINGIECAKDTTFSLIPFILRIGDKDYVDDKDLDVLDTVRIMNECKTASTSACGSPEQWADEFRKADKSIAVVISSGVSGQYNSAVQGMKIALEEDPSKRIHVIDSRSTGGQMAFLIWKINELIAAGCDFDDVVRLAEEHNSTLRILFTLSCYDNLVKNGRMSKIAGMLVTGLHIRAIGRGNEKGQLELLYKIQGEKKVFNKIVEEMGRRKDNIKQVIISHCNNIAGANKLKDLIQEKYKAIVYIMETRMLTSFYAQEYGIIVAY